MPDANLLSFIRNSEAQGRTEDVTRSLLVSAGWQEKDINDAFLFLKTGSQTSAHPQPQPKPAAEDAAPARQQPSPKDRFPKKTILVGAIAVIALAFIVGGGWIAYGYFANPSPRQVLHEMFQQGLSGMISADTDEQLSIDLHITPSANNPAARSGTAAFTSMLLGTTPSELSFQTEASGTYARIGTDTVDIDQNVSIGFGMKGSAQSVTMSASGEFRMVDGVVYIKITSFPNLGSFDATPLEGKWIALPVNTSTASMAADLSGQPSLTLPSTTLSAADIQKISSAAEGIFTITRELPDETIGGDPSYHYQYTVSEQGLENTADIAASFAPQSTMDSASATSEINSSIKNFFGTFDSIGGELWIGKNDHYLHRITLSLSFNTSTPFATVDGTVNATSTTTNINDGQTVAAPSDTESLQSAMQALLSPASSSPMNAALGVTQAEGRDARRISDLHEIQNGLELYYNKCGRYPGEAARAACPSTFTQISAFSTLSSVLEGSGLGIYSVPNDPSPGSTYYYGTDASGQNYIIAARLEDRANSVFSNYAPPSLAKIKISGITSCRAPIYCITL